MSALKSLRPSGADPIPAELMESLPLPEVSLPLNGGFSAGEHGFAGKRVVLDLDDTLLNSNYTCGEEWDAHAMAVQCNESIRYDRMRRSLRGWLNALQGKPKRQQYDSRRYPFLAQPEVEVQLRPGVVQVLTELKASGVQFFLVTASARARVDFLFARLPSLRALFCEEGVERVACAEEVETQVLEIDRTSDKELHKVSGLSDSVFEASVRAHRLRPRSLTMKTPLLLERLFGMAGYDLLVDDSERTADYFNQAGLQACLLQVDGGKPNTGYGLEIMEAMLTRLENNTAVPERVVFSGAYDALVKNSALVRMEDPLYYPYVHTHDQLPGGVST